VTSQPHIEQGPSALPFIAGDRRVDTVSARWIVGIDGSDHARTALRWAAAHAPGRTDEVVALATYHVPVGMTLLMAKRGFDVDRLGMEATAAHDVDVALESIAGRDGEGSGVSLRSKAVDGQPGPTLIEESASARLLIVGQRGAGEDHHTVLGSVSRYCSTHSTTPTVIVPPEWNGSTCTSIAVGFDGSENAEHALVWALDFAPDDAEINVVIAIEVSPWLEDELTRARFPEEVDRETTRLVARLESITDDDRVTPNVVLGDSRTALLDASGSSDLLVVGARGHGAIASALLGSVTTWILHHAPCPTAVIPHNSDSG
jgi:nucleotide-binding universal stress UspA family protein